MLEGGGITFDTYILFSQFSPKEFGKRSFLLKKIEGGIYISDVNIAKIRGSCQSPPFGQRGI